MSESLTELFRGLDSGERGEQSLDWGWSPPA
jgi:hypothetical protein